MVGMPEHVGDVMFMNWQHTAAVTDVPQSAPVLHVLPRHAVVGIVTCAGGIEMCWSYTEPTQPARLLSPAKGSKETSPKSDESKVMI